MLPALNEKQAVGRTLEQLQVVLTSAGLAAEDTVVDDGSEDGTAAEVARHPAVGLIRHAKDRGYGAALNTGIRQAKHEMLRYDVAGLLLVAMLVTWWLGRHGERRYFPRALHWSIVVSLLVPFWTGTTNQVLLLVPFLAWLRATCAQAHRSLPDRGLTAKQRGATIAVAVGGLQLSLWVLLPSTITATWRVRSCFCRYRSFPWPC